MSDQAIPAESVYLTFFIGAEEYALPLVRVSKVVGLERITHVPTAPSFIRGLVSVAEAAVPVVDLSRKFNATQFAAPGNQSVIVVHATIGSRSTLIGFVVDRLGKVLRLATERVLPPAPLDSLISVEFLTGVLEEDGYFVLFVDIDRVLDADEFAHVAELADGPVSTSLEIQTDVIPFLTIRLAGERCALNLSRLREAIECGRLTRIPGTPSYVLGAMNVRGSIVPVIDVAKRCGHGATRRDSNSRVILVDVGSDEHDAPVGCLVEAVEGLIRIPPDEISSAPPFGTRCPVELVEGMAAIAGELVPILNTERALSPDDDISALSGNVQPQ